MLVGKKHAYAPMNGLKMYYEIHGASVTLLVLLHDGGSTIGTTFGKFLPIGRGDTEAQLAPALEKISESLTEHRR